LNVGELGTAGVKLGAGGGVSLILDFSSSRSVSGSGTFPLDAKYAFGEIGSAGEIGVITSAIDMGTSRVGDVQAVSTESADSAEALEKAESTVEASDTFEAAEFGMETSFA